MASPASVNARTQMRFSLCVRPRNIATWNFRQFCKSTRHAPSLGHIAEIIRCFDLVSIVELGDRVDDLAAVLTLLGPDWDAVFSDYIPDPGGELSDPLPLWAQVDIAGDYESLDQQLGN